MVKEAADAISEADVWVGHYASRFDVPMMQSRLLSHDLKPMPNIPLVDTWRISKYKLKLHSNRLASGSAFFGMEDKTPLSGPIWLRAMAGHKPSIAYVVEHCRQDVVVLEQFYQKIKCLHGTHPNINLVDTKEYACPICASLNVQARGYNIARTSKRQRFQCRDCGAWSSGGPIKTSVKLR